MGPKGTTAPRRERCYCFVPDSFLCYRFASTDGDLISSVPETTTTKHSGGYLYGRQQLVLGPALNVTVRSGDQALMPCIAPHLGDRTVFYSILILINYNYVYVLDRSKLGFLDTPKRFGDSYYLDSCIYEVVY